MTSEEPSAELPAVATVSVKLPPFWPSDQEVWFAHVEVTFTTRRITAQWTKFDHVIASLSPEVATKVRDLILKPPEAEPYSVLKEQLVKRTASSEQRRLQQLLNTEELRDRKPDTVAQKNATTPWRSCWCRRRYFPQGAVSPAPSSECPDGSSFR